jgi:ADP-L-glycero-D-manno-heptose 6-epimerase
LICYDYKRKSNLTKNPSDLKAFVKKYSAKKQIVIHLGAVASTSHLEKELIQERNINFTEDLGKFCAENRIPIIFASSAAVYGRDMQKSREVSPLNFYGESKRFGELSLLSSYYKNPSDIVICRLFNVFGFGEQSKGTMMSVPSRFILDAITSSKIEIWGINQDFVQSRDFISVEDVVEILCLLISRYPWSTNLIDLGSGISSSFLDIAHQIETFKPIEIKLGKFPSYLDSQSYQVITKANTFPLFGLVGEYNFSPLSLKLKMLWERYHS